MFHVRIRVVATALMLVSAGLFAQPGERGFGGKFLDELKLSDEQKAKFESLRSEHLKSMIAQRAKVASARVDLRALLRADNVDRSAIEKQMKEVASLEVANGLTRLDHWTAVNKILTPEQQKVWKEHRKQAGMRGGRQGMKGMRGMRGMRGKMGMRGMRGHGMMRFDGDEEMRGHMMQRRMQRMDD